MARRYNYRAVRIHRSYEVSDVADLLGVTEQTVRAWIKAGLPVLNSKRPVLILGFKLRKFLQTRYAKTKNPLAVGEFYCMHCRQPKKPLGMMADYLPVNPRCGRLMALCESCEGRCCRSIRKVDLPEFGRVLEIAVSSAKQD